MLAAIWTDWNGVVDKISFGCSWVHAMFWVEVLFDCSSYAACWLWEIVADARIYLISLPLQKHGCMLWHSKNHFLQQKLNSLLQDKGWLFEWTHVDTSRDTSGMIRSLYKGQGSSAAPPDSRLLPRPIIHNKVYAARRWVFKPVSQKSSLKRLEIFPCEVCDRTGFRCKYLAILPDDN